MMRKSLRDTHKHQLVCLRASIRKMLGRSLFGQYDALVKKYAIFLDERNARQTSQKREIISWDSPTILITSVC